MPRINLSKHAYVDIPDELPLVDNKLNIMFQYRWHAAAPPDKSNLKAVIVYADSPGLNSGASGELGTPDFIYKSIDKITKRANAELGKWGISAYSGGGIAFYHLFRNNLNKPNAIIMSDADYGGKATLSAWKSMAEQYVDSADDWFVMFHTHSLEARFDSTAKTANELIKSLGIGGATTEIDSKVPFWQDWHVKPAKWTQKGGLIILDAPEATHADAGKLVPTLLNSFLTNWNV